MTQPPEYPPTPTPTPTPAPTPGIESASPRRLSGVIEPTRRVSSSPRPGAVPLPALAVVPRPPVPLRTPAPPAEVPDDPDPAVRVRAYLGSLGVGESAADRLWRGLEQQVDADVTEPGKRTAAMIAALDHWFEALPEKLDLPEQFDRVGFVAAMHWGRLLDQHPGCLEDPAGLIADLQQRLDGWPDGVLPNWERQTMDRQPLGELPTVLRGEFWSGTYRWFVPVGASTGQRFRRGRRDTPAAFAAAAPDLAPGIGSAVSTTSGHVPGE